MPSVTKSKKPAGIRNELLDTLSEVDRPGDVCASGDRPLTMPGLEVKGLGAIRLPLAASQARDLIKRCRQAPYGKGTKTVVDTDVRRVWELDPKQFKLINPKWNDCVDSILSAVKESLGLAGRKLKAQLYKLLTAWRDEAEPKKLAVTLEHRYTQDGLTIDKLKGIDRARADVLFAAAEQADCVAHLALVTLWQSGSADGGYDAYSYGYGQRYHWSDDEDDEDCDETTSRYEMGEVYEQSLTADHWSDRQGKKVRLGEVHLSEDEIVAEVALDELEPSSEDFEGFTGNAGMTLDRWYHRAAVVIWPRARQFHVLCEAGTKAAVGGLESMVKSLKRAAKNDRDCQRQECLDFARAIVDSWQEGSFHSSWTKPASDHTSFSAALCALDATDILRRFLSQVMPGDGTVQLDKSFAGWCQRHGWLSFEPELSNVLAATNADTIDRNMELLQMLCTLRDKNAERIKLCRLLCDRSVTAFEAFDGKRGTGDWQVLETDRAALLRSLVTAMLAVGAERPLGRFIDHTMSSNKYDLTDVHLAAIFALEKQLAKLPAPSGAVRKWLGGCCRELERRTAEPPRPPVDYRRASKLSCRCPDCKALSRFLADRTERVVRFPIPQHRRQHLQQIIDASGCDCRHVTERRGRPQSLVCTKTTASYQSACKIHERDMKHLKRVTALRQTSG